MAAKSKKFVIVVMTVNKKVEKIADINGKECEIMIERRFASKSYSSERAFVLDWFGRAEVQWINKSNFSGRILIHKDGLETEEFLFSKVEQIGLEK